MSDNDLSSYITDRFTDPNSVVNRVVGDAVYGPQRNNDNFSLSNIPATIIEEATKRIFGDGSLATDIYNKIRLENEEANAERKDNRGSFARVVSDLLGSNTLTDARSIQIGLRDLIRNGGGELEANSSIANSLRVGQDMMSRFKASSGASVQDRFTEAMQDVGTSMSGMSNDDILSISSGLSGNGFSDMDGDGDVDKDDIALAQAGKSLQNEIRLLHPLISKMHRNPNFMVRQIDRKTIKNENTGNRNNQVNLVTQGIAAYIEDVNMFNVKY
jgi:hypothetical protein